MLELETMKELVTIVGLDVALKVASMETVQLSIKLKNSDFLPGGFAKRVIKRFNRAHWTMQEVECANILDIVEACQLYEQEQSMDGFGGCIAVSLKCTLEREGFVL